MDKFNLRIIASIGVIATTLGGLGLGLGLQKNNKGGGITTEWSVGTSITRADLINEKADYVKEFDGSSTWDDDFYPAILDSGYLENKDIMKNDLACAVFEDALTVMSWNGIFDWSGKITCGEPIIHSDWWQWKNVSIKMNCTPKYFGDDNIYVNGVELISDTLSIGGSGTDDYVRQYMNDDLFVMIDAGQGQQVHENKSRLRIRYSTTVDGNYQWGDDIDYKVDFWSYYLEGMFSQH